MSQAVSLLSLRVFAAVAQHGSFRGAAVSLCVTPAAISQHIRALEERLGTDLLERRHREVRLTIDGVRLSEMIIPPFQQIEDSLGQFSDVRSEDNLLTVHAPAPFAALWLLPRLGAFKDRHSGVEIHLNDSASSLAAEPDAADISVCHGNGNFPGLSSTLLMRPQKIIVAAPALLNSGEGIRTLADCLRYPLLQDRTRNDWLGWFRSYDLQIDSSVDRGMSFENDLLLLKAVGNGLGLAIVHDIHAYDDLKAGRLVKVFQSSRTAVSDYYLVCQPSRKKLRKIEAFRDWLIAELRHCDLYVGET